MAELNLPPALREPDLLDRMRARAKNLGVATIHDLLLAALADEVRQYDAEARAKAYAEEHRTMIFSLGMHTPAAGCGICDLARANDPNARLVERDGGLNPS